MKLEKCVFSIYTTFSIALLSGEWYGVKETTIPIEYMNRRLSNVSILTAQMECHVDKECDGVGFKSKSVVGELVDRFLLTEAEVKSGETIEENMFATQKLALPMEVEYKRIAKTLSWPAAEAHCNGEGGHLLSYNNGVEFSHIIKKNYGRIWIGLNDEVTEGVFVFSDGTKPTSTLPWGPYQPVSGQYGKYSNCVFLHKEKLYTEGCSRRFNSVCKILTGP